MLSTLPEYRMGSKFTYNPLGIRNLKNNLRWPDYFVVDMKLSKTFDFKFAKTTLYIDVSNIFNNKVNWMSNGWAWRDGTNGIDYNNYFSSLHLSIYDSPEYDNLRELNPGMYIAGNDKVGDLRSASKPYINDPDNAMFLFGEPRNIWFGARIEF